MMKGKFYISVDDCLECSMHEVHQVTQGQLIGGQLKPVAKFKNVLCRLAKADIWLGLEYEWCDLEWYDLEQRGGSSQAVWIYRGEELWYKCPKMRRID